MFLHSGVFVHGSHIHSPATSESFAAAKEHLAEAEQKYLKICKNIDDLPVQGKIFLILNQINSNFYRYENSFEMLLLKDFYSLLK